MLFTPQLHMSAQLCATSDTEFKSDSEMEGLNTATTTLERQELEEPSFSSSTVRRRDHPTGGYSHC